MSVLHQRCGCIAVKRVKPQNLHSRFDPLPFSGPPS
jgi:hypothetical protein